MPSIFPVILAAGRSSRLGTPKQQLELAGQTLLERTLLSVSEACGEAPLIILGHAWEDTLGSVDNHNFLLAINRRWQQGMGTSLALAAAEMPAAADALLITVCDMPLVDARFYRQLLELYACRRETPVCAAHAAGPGVPAVLPARWRRDLMGMSADAGARQLLRATTNIVAVGLGDRALDVDTAADAAAAQQILAARGD